MSPVVSVNMPVRNAERYLPAAIESILGQTLGDLELIAIDDGSTDGSWKILQHYAQRDPRVVTWTRENRGIYTTRNEALSRSRGDFIAVMDSDDIALPERLEKQVEYLRAHPDCVALGARVLMIDPEGEPLCEWFFCETHQEIEDAHMQGRSGAIPNPVCTMRRSAMMAVGGYRQSFNVSEDYDLFLRLAEAGGQLANLPLILGKYRQHLSSVSYTTNEKQRKAAETALRDARRRRGLPAVETTACPEEMHVDGPARFPELDIHRKWAWWALGAGHVSTARKHALSVVRRAPLSAESWRVLACALRGY
jgi:glycosyltransferase involved in cell wall biosynthesis